MRAGQGREWRGSFLRAAAAFLRFSEDRREEGVEEELGKEGKRREGGKGGIEAERRTRSLLPAARSANQPPARVGVAAFSRAASVLAGCAAWPRADGLDLARSPERPRPRRHVRAT
ncbi:hypothetical protein PR202_gb26903 [Eleusine coracana subsp. coracana]|uniref:Uncharacterized protein n=1 Tax=Eleusine coracana subsp. coracana TaxID=191504 RepID=A0AAV5FQ45_ELECO|nr:hypothetical protein PR202_gb26903 [Eleusine coracana subsp. coracana]